MAQTLSDQFQLKEIKITVVQLQTQGCLSWFTTPPPPPFLFLLIFHFAVTEAKLTSDVSVLMSRSYIK